jgi:hypothetical protein
MQTLMQRRAAVWAKQLAHHPTDEERQSHGERWREVLWEMFQAVEQYYATGGDRRNATMIRNLILISVTCDEDEPSMGMALAVPNARWDAFTRAIDGPMQRWAPMVGVLRRCYLVCHPGVGGGQMVAWAARGGGAAAFGLTATENNSVTVGGA